MKRIKKITLILFFVMFFIPLTVVKADATCADVKSAVNRLNSIETAYTKNKCDESATFTAVAECNELLVSKSAVLKEIFEYNDDKVCSSINLSSIISENKSNCTNELSSDLKKLTDTVMQFFYILAPFILIIFGSLDFFKIITSNNPAEIKKNRNNFFKRVVAFVLLYLSPLFVRTIFSITPYNLDSSNYICTQEISLTTKETSSAISGIYDPTSSGGGDAGKKIAETARKLKKHTVEKGYYWTCNFVGINQFSSRTDSLKYMCCAELIAPTIYKAVIYDKATASKLHTASAAGVYNNFKDKGWTLITDSKKLKPGDILFYDTGCRGSHCGRGTIKGQSVAIGHVDIYYGDGKVVSTGGDVWDRKINGHKGAFVRELGNFSSSSGHRFVGALRYPGK